MSFDKVLDQTVAVRLLRRLLRRGRVPHGLLFWGPDGVGKRLAAAEMAKAVNCTGGQGDDACDTCLPCRKTEQGNHPDVMYLVPVKRARIINVEAIDSVNEMASLRPYEGARRVFIFEDADRMNAPAQNHFLKTLEEPPGNALFLLVTASPRALLPTIRSRCQQVRFGALRPETVAALLLERRDLPRETAGAIAALSQGQMARALSLVDSDNRDVVIDITRRLATGDDPLAVSDEFAGFLAARKAAAEAAVKGETLPEDVADMTREDREALKEEQVAAAVARFRRDLMELLYLFETWYRDAMVLRATGEEGRVLNRDHLDFLRGAPEGDYGGKLAAIEKARVYIERFLNEERVFRDLFFELAA
ncbi:MAG TPA: DNA polymerase III subunit delta' [Candidatus Hydrogenedentes bacterium]|nr:DNA polymerase III subunit delta' [Candidatus Hydrogenedentota bacterium]HNT88977.1 DNA polymerase III subunit delta' [Candidatus Hydrogenedentota bacterium]